MAYPGLNLLMEKLKRIIYSKDDPLICNHPCMLSKRPQLQLLYEGLGWMTRPVFVEKSDSLQELEEVRNLKKRFKDVVEEAQDKVDLFVSVINFKNKKLPRISNFFEMSLDLEDVMRSIKSIKKDFIRILKSQPSHTRTTSAAVTSCSRNSPVWDEIVVGLDQDIVLIRDKLVEDTRKLDIVSIVGMGGSGKTTLATKVFNDPYVAYHFYERGWVTVSQTPEKLDLLNQIVASVGVEIDPEQRDNYPHLRQKLHQQLMGKRYLVVIDDIWNKVAWDDLKLFFPDHNNGSRLLLTSRNKEVALHANSHGVVHQLRCLTEEESWELLQKKVFHGNSFPDSLTRPGMRIARNCNGLPLAVVVMAGVLAKEPVTIDSWERISISCSSLINDLWETLALSLKHLPSHLRGCFLYLGGFPEDYKFQVTRLIWLWIAEGFIQADKKQSLEETATDYLMELVDRNLVVVQERKIDGAIKTVSVHDVLKELCLEVATKERFCLKVQGSDHFTFAPHETRRIFTDRYIGSTNATRIRSLLSSCSFPYVSHIISKCSTSWTLLLVLDLKKCPLIYVPDDISLLVNLRYLAIQCYHTDFQSRICDLWYLQTLIIEGISNDPWVLPNTISNLVSLRHFWSHRTIIFPPLETPFMNLQTISSVVLIDEPKSWKKYFPCVKKLSCFIYLERKYDLQSLSILETLKVSSMKYKGIPRFKKNSITFPALLKKLTLKGCCLPWSYMSQIQSLPNLEVLKLLKDAFVGPRWDACDEPFQQLKFLKLMGLDIQQWEASSNNFPCLKELFLVDCDLLEGIPLELRYVPTLEHIQIKSCSIPVITSADEIKKEQHADGNYDLEISFDRAPIRSRIDTKDSSIGRLKYILGRAINPIRTSQWVSNMLLEDKLAELVRTTEKWNFFSRLFGIAPSIKLLYYRPKGKLRSKGKLNLLNSEELEALGLPIDHPPVLQAQHHIFRSRIRNHERSKYGPIRRKILKGGGRIRSFQN